MPDLHVLSSLAFASLLEALGPAFEATAGATLKPELAPTNLLVPRIQAGERADVAILTADAVAGLVRAGTLSPGTERPLAVSTVGVAARAGAAHPPITDAASLRAALLGARSIGLSRSGASGGTMLAVFAQLGIAEAVAPGLVWIESGYTGQLVADGRAELAVQQVSELKSVAGIELIGTVPAGLGAETTFSGAVFAGVADPARAASLLSMIAAATPQLLKAGLTPL